jgi:NADPH-dependent ferric siderophore reductase
VEAHGHAGAGSPEVAMRTPRSYTVTQWNPAEGAFALEFVLHGGGPAALWAARAETGEELPLAGPMGRFMFPGGVQRILLAGDTTALPAIRELAASAPADAQVVAVVEAPASEQLDTGSRVRVKWTDPGELVRLAEAGGLIPSAWDPADPTISVWIAGEAHDAAATRFALLTMGVWPAAIHASAYWRRY